ncbi:MAG: hypothetical protein JW786_02810 [Desulfobacterales bacterium]|nr:hypothetical protein [Desulfobacterales bacterium]
MTLTVEQLKQIAKDYIRKDSPDLAAEEPTHQEEDRIVDKAAGAKLGLGHPKKIPTKVSVFTFKKIAIAEDGAKIPIVARVTVDADGNVVKATGN